MYYEEQVVNGVLCYRTTPRGPWHHVSAETLTTRLLAAQKQARIPQDELARLSDDWHTPSDWR